MSKNLDQGQATSRDDGCGGEHEFNEREQRFAEMLTTLLDGTAQSAQRREPTTDFFELPPKERAYLNELTTTMEIERAAALGELCLRGKKVDYRIGIDPQRRDWLKQAREELGETKTRKVMLRCERRKAALSREAQEFLRKLSIALRRKPTLLDDFGTPREVAKLLGERFPGEQFPCLGGLSHRPDLLIKLVRACGENRGGRGQRAENSLGATLAEIYQAIGVEGADPKSVARRQRRRKTGYHTDMTR